MIPWGTGTPIAGTPFRVAVTAAETNGAAVVFTVEMPVGEIVPPHVHDDEDQINIVISGRVGCRLGATESTLEAGGVVMLPRGIEHSLWNAGESPARVMEVYTPPGIENFFAEAGARGGFHPE